MPIGAQGIDATLDMHRSVRKKQDLTQDWSTLGGRRKAVRPSIVYESGLQGHHNEWNIDFKAIHVYLYV